MSMKQGMGIRLRRTSAWPALEVWMEIRIFSGEIKRKKEGGREVGGEVLLGEMAITWYLYIERPSRCLRALGLLEHYHNNICSRRACL